MFTHRFLKFYLFSTAWLILAGVFAGCVSPGTKSGAAVPARFVMDMVQDNPGEPQQPSAFRDPRHLADWGYNGQVIEAGADSCETFDAIAPDVLPKDSEARIWIERNRLTPLESRRLRGCNSSSCRRPWWRVTKMKSATSGAGLIWKGR
jgi:hypothetical protein